jgi:hypothetical protein
VAAAEAAEVAAMVMVFFTRRFLLLLWLWLWLCWWLVGGGWWWVVGSLTLPESRSSNTYLNRPFRKSKSIITI